MDTELLTSVTTISRRNCIRFAAAHAVELWRITMDRRFGANWPVAHERCRVCFVFMRRSPAETQASENRVCVRGDTLFAFNTQSSNWVAQRPVGAGMTMKFVRTNKDTVTYTTGHVSADTISNVPLRVVTTTVLTVDSLGMPRRRLTERYALSLVTATGGRFEVPQQPARSPTVWALEQEFSLREIIKPQ